MLPTNKSNPQPVADDVAISVFRIRADECDRLWVMDTGVSDIWGDYDVVAPPAIVIYDLKTNQLIRRFVIPDDNIKETTFFANIVSARLTRLIYLFFCSAEATLYYLRLSKQAQTHIHSLGTTGLVFAM